MKLCQRANASCAACCGLYNRPDAGREEVRDELRRHGRALARAVRTVEGFRDAARRLGAEAPQGLFPSLRTCMLAGFLDDAESRVGCLAHPKATGGPDLRACGAYGVETCEAFLCPSHAELDEPAAAIVEAATDWYLYGLVATDAPFVHAVLEAIRAEAGRGLEPDEARDSRISAALKWLLALKEELAPGSDGHFGPFRHGRRAEDGAGEGSAGAEAILDALGADERSGNDPERLLPEVTRRLVACAAAVRGARGERRPR
jgi:hypothetical protein